MKTLDCFKDGDLWDHMVSSYTTDPHYYSGFYRAYGGGKLALSSSGLVMKPFRYQETGWIGNAYNFGGPIGDLLGMADFEKEFDLWLDYHGLSERCTLNPYMNEQPHPHYAVSKAVVWINLLNNTELRDSTKSMVKRAKENNVTVEEEVIGQLAMSEFETLYNESMDRKQAAPHWYYNRGFFDELAHEMVGKVRLFTTWVGNTLESSCVLIHDDDTCYYHWAATTGKNPNLGANHLQVMHTIAWAKGKHMKRLHLGGGLTDSPDDGLYIFKSGFSPARAACLSYVKPHTRGEI